MKLLSRVIIFLCLVSPAHARHCPRGDIWRVHADICVPKGGHRVRAIRSEIPSHHGITYVTVIEPPPSKPTPPAEINIPYRLPPSRWDHPAIVHFDALPPVVPGVSLSNTARKE
jgi:hypothetical protein